jgi:putative DNA primase/helicase
MLMRTVAKQVLSDALFYVSKGVPIFPVHHAQDGGCSCGDPTCKNVAKHPAVPGEAHGDEHATLDEDQVKRWFGDKGQRRGYNIGASCRDGLICLDVDPKNGGLDSFKDLIRDHSRLPETWTEETGEDAEGNRGLHYWFLIPQGKQYKKRKALGGYPGIDLLANGYAIVAPSIHASGVRYETLIGVDEIQQAPQWLLDLTSEIEVEDVLPGGRSLAEPTGIRPGPDVRKFLRRGGVEPGGQRSMACKAARALWGIWVEADDATDLIWQAMQKCEWGEGDWTENQIRKLVMDEYAKQPSTPLDTANGGVPLLSDLGRAHRLRAFSRGNIRYDHSQGLWYVWDTTAWMPDGIGTIARQVHSMSMTELAEGQLSEQGTDKRKEAIRIQSASKISNILHVAKDLETIAMTSTEFDRDPFLLNCSNCVVDLRNGSTREQKREDYMTKVTACAYYPSAESKLWDRVVKDATSGDEDLADFLQLAFGYAATGDTREDTFFYLHGPGGSGKTTVLEAVANTMGTYSTAADPETFMLTQATMGTSHRADLAALKDARLVISTEIQQGSKFSTSTLNRLTGRDTISARVPYARAPIVFRPQWTLFFAANHFPQVPGATRRDGFWRRVKILPFDNALDKAKMNPVLPYLLSKDEHAQAVLRWVIDGAQRWWHEYASQGRLMPVPSIVEGQVADIQEQEDPLVDFVDTLVFDPGEYTPRSLMFTYYQAWADKEGIKMPLKRNRFTSTLRSSLEGRDIREGEREWGKDRKRERTWEDVALPKWFASLAG